MRRFVLGDLVVIFALHVVAALLALIWLYHSTPLHKMVPSTDMNLYAHLVGITPRLCIIYGGVFAVGTTIYLLSRLAESKSLVIEAALLVLFLVDIPVSYNMQTATGGPASVLLYLNYVIIVLFILMFRPVAMNITFVVFVTAAYCLQFVSHGGSKTVYDLLIQVVGFWSIGLLMVFLRWRLSHPNGTA